MGIIVKKFGGSSVGSIERIKAIADHLVEEKRKGKTLVVVVSAMAKTTDLLISLAHEISEHPNPRELDMLLTAGERISMSLLALALHERNEKSISFTGSQSGIITDCVHGNAKIQTVNAFRIKEELEKNKIVIVAGFQGVSSDKEITTLGRGGSDTSAVALSCYLQAELCEIFTDVDGVYTSDPRYISSVKKINRISYEQMLFLTYGGSKVLHPRSVEFAMKYNIPIEVKSSFTFQEGTMVLQNMEQSTVKALAHKDRLKLLQIKSEKALWEIINIIQTDVFDLYVQSDEINVLFEDQYTLRLTDELKSQLIDYKINDDIYTSFTLTGIRIANDKDFLEDFTYYLSNNNQEIYQIQTSGLGLKCLVKSNNLEELLKLIHDKYVIG